MKAEEKGSYSDMDSTGKVDKLGKKCHEINILFLLYYLLPFKFE